MPEGISAWIFAMSIKSFSNIINLAAKYITNVMCIFMTIVVLLQVLLRYIAGFSLFWADEAARYILVWITFLGASIALKNRANPSIEFIKYKFPHKARIFIEILTSILILFFLSITIYFSIPLLVITQKQLSPALRIPMGVVYIAVPIGCLVMAIHTLLFLTENLRDFFKSVAS